MRKKTAWILAILSAVFLFGSYRFLLWINGYYSVANLVAMVVALLIFAGIVVLLVTKKS